MPAPSNLALSSSKRSGLTDSAMCWTLPMVSQYVRVIVAGKVEEPEQRPVAEVEEEVAGAVVVAVLDQFDQREAEEILVERDRLLDVAADQREVMDARRSAAPAARPCGRTYFARELVATGTDGFELGTLGLRHWPAPSVA